MPIDPQNNQTSTLQDTLRKNPLLVRNQAGELSELSTTPGIQQLAAQQGLQAPPTTPLGQALIGANADQQKMAGTPQQKQAAVQLASQPNQSLEDATRRQPVRTQATQQEQSEIQKSASLQGLGSIGDQVQGLINTHVAAMAAQPATNVPTAQSLDSYNGQDLTSLKPLLAQLHADPTNQQLMLQLNQALGRTTANPLSAADVQGMYEQAVTSVAANAQGNWMQSLTAGDLLATGNIGYTADQLSGLLEIPQDQLAGMTVAQLRDRVAALQSQEVSAGTQTQAAIHSAGIGQAEKQFLGQAAREQGAVGITASEADMQKLHDSIARADQVQFGGQQYSVEDLLKSGTISKVVTDYVNAPEGSAIRTQLEQTEPGLVSFIRNNQAALTSAANKLSAGATQFAQTQQFNTHDAVSAGGQSLTASALRVLVPNYGQLSADRADLSATPVLDYIHRLPSDQGAGVVSAINTVAASNPDVVGQLGHLSAQEVASLGIGKPGSNWELVVKQLQENIPRRQDMLGKQDGDAMIREATGGKYQSVAQASQDMRTAFVQNNVLGLGPRVSSEIMNPDGSLNTGGLNAWIAGSVNPPDLSAIAKGDRSSLKSYSATIPQPQQLAGVDQDIFQKLGQAASKGSVSTDDIKRAGLSVDDLIRMQDLGGPPRGGNWNPTDVDEQWLVARNGNTADTIRSVTASGKPLEEQIGMLTQELKQQGERKLNPNQIQERINTLNTVLGRPAEQTRQTQQSIANVNRISQAQQYTSSHPYGSAGAGAIGTPEISEEAPGTLSASMAGMREVRSAQEQQQLDQVISPVQQAVMKKQGYTFVNVNGQWTAIPPNNAYSTGGTY